MKKVLIFILAMCTGLYVFAQEKTTMELLEANTWCIQSENPNPTYRKFKNNVMYVKWTSSYGDEVYQFEYPFYLSTTKDKEFRKEKVGKSNSGKYLIWYNEKKQLTYVYEITFISTVGLIIESTEVLYGGGEREIYNKYVGYVYWK
ncbi:MAG: hypothetical protein LIO79_04085 [Rikenellaceae bacterium]|nr:hypothetical protein [Rikenellaceae bacterium]